MFLSTRPWCHAGRCNSPSTLQLLSIQVVFQDTFSLALTSPEWTPHSFWLQPSLEEGRTENRNLEAARLWTISSLLHTSFIAAWGYITLTFTASHITQRTYASQFICLFVFPYVLLLSHISPPVPVPIRRGKAPSVVSAQALESGCPPSELGAAAPQLCRALCLFLDFPSITQAW